MELIPITDFDRRYFPEVTEDEKIDFILHSNEMERIFMKREEVQSNLLFQGRAHPAVSGQMRCIHLVIQLAENPNLFPKANLITMKNFDSQFPWLKQLHKNLLHDFWKKGEELINSIDYPSKDELGQYRIHEKSLGHRQMPPPEQIQPLLISLFQDYSSYVLSIKDQLDNPRLMEESDWKNLERKIYTTSLGIACIKPFQDGSNRVSRLTENLLRLNAGLKFKIRDDKDQFLRDVQEHQDRYYKF
jgi:hypothetical protein